MVVATSAGLRPRRAVLDEAWLSADLDCPSLSGADGRPLARTVKCLLDPLLVRPRLNPDLARPLLDPDAAARLAGLVGEHREVLHGTDRWYARLRAARRARGITSGNPQELYFPRAWELSFRYGDPADDEVTARRVGEALDAAHPDSDEGSVIDHLVRPEVAARAVAAWQAAWRVAPSEAEVDADLTDVAGRCRDLLDGGPAQVADVGDLAADAAAASRLGAWARAVPELVARLAAEVVTGPGRVRLSAHDPVSPPPVTASGRAGVLPLDRSLAERVQATRRRQRARGETADLATTVDDEVGRSCAPWGLDDPVAHLVLMAGVVVAAGLDPLAIRGATDPGPDRPVTPGLVAETDARLRKEAYVLHLRRLLHDRRPVDPSQQSVADDLAEAWRPYLTRLWVRLHGLDSGREVPGRVDEARDLLTGVARSVSLDLRTRIRTALERSP